MNMKTASVCHCFTAFDMVLVQLSRLSSASCDCRHVCPMKKITLCVYFCLDVLMVY